MPATTLRASCTIAVPILRRFNAVVPHGERSRVMEELMKQALAAREAELEHVAAAFLADPAFAECRDDEKRSDVTAGDGLETYEHPRRMYASEQALAPETVLPLDASLKTPLVPGLSAIEGVNPGVYRQQQLKTRSPIGLVGEAWCATPEKGQRLLDAISRDVADALSNQVLWDAPI